MSYTFGLIANATGSGGYFPNTDYPGFIINLSSGDKREIRSWVIGRLFRDLEKDIDHDGKIADHKVPHDSLHVEVYKFVATNSWANDTLRPKRDLLWWSFVVALILQIGVAIIPVTPTSGRQKPNFYILLITVVGTLLSLLTASLQATKGEKYGRTRLGCRDMFALTKGNGYNIVIIILPNSIESKPQLGEVSRMPHLARMATASYRPTKTSKVRAFVLGGLWIVLLLIIGGASTDSWYLLLVGGIGIVHTVYVAGGKRRPEAHGFPLTRLNREWVFKGGRGQMDVLVALEEKIPGAGYLLRRELFNRPTTVDDKAKWKKFVDIEGLNDDEMIAIARKQIDKRQLATVTELRGAIQGHIHENFDNIPADAIRDIVIDRMRIMSETQRKDFTKDLLRNLDTDERMMRFIAARRATFGKSSLFVKAEQATQAEQVVDTEAVTQTV